MKNANCLQSPVWSAQELLTVRLKSPRMIAFVLSLLLFGFLVWLFKIPQIAELAYKYFPPRKVYDTESQINDRGITCETHVVTTEDGYILKIFRMYRSLPTAGEVALLQHGMMSNSTDWVAFDGSIAFQLADLGWDIWLGNHRGNLYCRQHVELPLNSRRFWEYSFHEHGTKDLPAVIDFILETTHAARIVYIGHSQGCAEFFAMASMMPEMNRKIKAMFALSPVCGLRHARTRLPLLYRIAQLERLGPRGSLFYSLGLRRKLLGFEPIRPLFQPFAKIFIDIVLYPIANWLLTGVLVYSNCSYPHPDLVADCLEYFLLLRIRNGLSALQIKHFAQSLSDDYYFHQLDRGKNENLRIYGQPRPPAYNVRNVTTHVSLIWGQDDACVVPTDLKKLHDRLSNVSVLYIPKYKHLDFTCSIKYLDKIMNHIISITRKISSSPDEDIPDTQNVPSSSGLIAHDIPGTSDSSQPGTSHSS